MRGSRLLVVMLAALALSGCLGRPQPYPYHYVYAQPQVPQPGAVAQLPAGAAVAQAPVYQAQAQGYPTAPVYQPPAAPPAAQTPAPRGLFAQGGPLAQMPYQRRGYPAPCSTPGCAPPPAYQAPPVQAAPMMGAAPAYQPVSAYAAYAPQGGYLQGYLLDAGDRLRITVFGQQGLTNSYAVDAAGNITMPLVGAIPARGLTTDQLSQSIAERLRQGYIREPQVAIEVEAYRPFFIHGEVGTPGQYPYVANMTVENAIAIAGGFGPRADKSKVTLTRVLGGQSVKATVGLSYPLRPGDTLRVGERWF